MNPSKSFDAVVIGGGFAGVTAARDLTEQGNAVLLLEARDRLGGRTWSKTFPGTDIAIEMGGTYILSDSPALRREMQRYGVDAHQAIWPESYPTLLNGVHRPGPSPVPFEQVFDLERAGIHMVLAASRITPGMPIDHSMYRWRSSLRRSTCLKRRSTSSRPCCRCCPSGTRTKAPRCSR